MNNIQHIPISSVPQPLLRAIDELWTDAFNWQPVPNDEEVEADPEASLFLLRSDNNEEILATAVVKSFNIRFDGTTYPVQGILNVVSAVKKQGYGRMVMEAVKEWLIAEQTTGLGFAKRSVSGFYSQCGYQVEKDLVERFREEAEDGTLTPHPDGEEDVIYVNERANLIQTILRKPTCWAYIPEFW